MSHTVYVDGVGPAINAVWLNDIDTTVYVALGSGGVAPATAAAVVTNLNAALLAGGTALSATNATNVVGSGTVSNNTTGGNGLTAGNLAGTPAFFAPITASLGADVSIIAAATYYDGPSVSQGTSGKWFVSGTVIVIDSGAATAIAAKLWDGTTVLASTESFTISGTPLIMSLSGVISAPTANLRISVKDISNTTGRIAFNTSGNSKDSTITAIRIG
jgi:hypothetical protein